MATLSLGTRHPVAYHSTKGSDDFLLYLPKEDEKEKPKSNKPKRRSQPKEYEFRKLYTEYEAQGDSSSDDDSLCRSCSFVLMFKPNPFS